MRRRAPGVSRVRCMAVPHRRARRRDNAAWLHRALSLLTLSNAHAASRRGSALCNGAYLLRSGGHGSGPRARAAVPDPHSEAKKAPEESKQKEQHHRRKVDAAERRQNLANRREQRLRERRRDAHPRVVGRKAHPRENDGGEDDERVGVEEETEKFHGRELVLGLSRRQTTVVSLREREPGSRARKSARAIRRWT